MFKKSNRSFRQRTRHSDSENEDDIQNDEKKAMISDTQESSHVSDPELVNDNSDLNSKSSNNKIVERKTKLSFEGDEEEDVFIVKKSVYSRRMEKNKQKLLKSKNTNSCTLKQQENSESNKQATLDNENVKSTIVTDVKDNDVIICPDSENDDEENEDYIPLKDSGPQFRSALERGIIPDAKTIYELKKQRQKLARTANEDFIPFENDDIELLANISGERLARESEEDKSEDGDLPNLDDEDDEDEDRIQFGNVDYQTKEKEKFKERFRIVQGLKNEKSKNKKHSDEEDESDFDSDNDEKQAKDESEDEMEKWEREQIRKAVRLPNIYSYNKSEMNTNLLDDKNSDLINKLQVIHDNHNVVPIEVDQETKSFGNYIPNYIINQSNIWDLNKNLDSFGDEIQNTKKRMESLIEEKKQLHDRVCMDLKLTSDDIASYDSDVKQIGEDYNFYRDMLDYVRNICDCINDKIPLLKKIEGDMIQSCETFSKKKMNQHRNEIQIQNSISLIFLLNHEDFSRRFSQVENLRSIIDLYNFRGQVRLKSDVLAKEQKNKNLKAFDFDESDNEHAVSCHEDISDIKNQMFILFQDTKNDFAIIKNILDRFKEWKDKRIETYKESFVTEFLPKILTYYIRYDIMLWNLFDKDSTLNIMEMMSIQDLFLYVTSNSIPNSDLVDINLIPELIDNSILPRVISLIERECWNPLSARQTKRLVAFLNLLLSNFPTLVDNSEKLPILLQKIILAMEKTIENDIFIPQMIPLQFFMPSSQRSHYDSLVVSYVVGFFDHQYWQTFRMMTNVILFRHLINEQIIKELALDKIFSRYILMSIERASSDTEKTMLRINRVFSNIPKEWFQNLNGDLPTFLKQLLRRPEYCEEMRQRLLVLLKEHFNM